MHVLGVNGCARRRACGPTGRLRPLTPPLRHAEKSRASRPEQTKDDSMSTLYVRSGTEFREATTEEISSHPAVIALLPELENERNPHSFHVRHLLVGTHQDLRIQGRWFERAGFPIGTRVSVRVLRKRLIVDVVQEPPQVAPRRYRRSAPSESRA
jgi:hypothetical protein